MHLMPDGPEAGNNDDYLTSKWQAWFAFAMTFTLMLFDYIDRQVIVSLFPHIKSEWNLSDNWGPWFPSFPSWWQQAEYR
jgi:hypothetical protein